MTLLAADIQEEILFLEVKGGVERISQRMLRRKNPEMTLLAADIQEEILFLEVKGGVERISQRMLREVVCVADWREQRRCRRTALRLRGRGTWARLKVTMRCATAALTDMEHGSRSVRTSHAHRCS
jgi:hypothetical protein